MARPRFDAVRNVWLSCSAAQPQVAAAGHGE
eukprot:SAG11_NODE_13608_length_647_cov_1.465328_1_plen_30_part_10